jgi:hypothetical protein
MRRPLNIQKIDIVQTCFCCPVQTRLILIEEIYNFPICEACLFKISSVEIMLEDVEAAAREYSIN